VGLGALVWGIASVTIQLLLVPEGVRLMQSSPLGVATIALFIVGTYLIFKGIFNHELTFDQKRRVVEDRETYLPILQDTVDKMLARKYELAIQAGRQPLEDYYDRYLSRNKAYDKAYKNITNADESIRRKVVIIVALKNQRFHKYNPYLSELEHSPKDPLYEYQTTCDNLISRCGDRGLSRAINNLFKTANQYHSVLALAEIGLGSGLHLKASKYYKVLYQKPQLLKPFITFYHNTVNKKIESLRQGDDL